MENLIKNIKEGKIFIYPTDTIYGLGSDATNLTAVNKIKKIKSRDKDKPLSIIAPSMAWIEKHLIIPKNLDLNKYLPGPYTIILKKQNPTFLNHISPTDSLGIRIPDIELTKEIQSSNLPFVTTSVNLSGEPFLTDLKDLDSKIKDQVDLIIPATSILSGKPSTLIINGKELKR